MKTQFIAFAAALVFALLFFAGKIGAQTNEDYSQEAINQNAQAMYNDLMQYASQEAINQNAQTMYSELMQLVNETYEQTYKEAMQIANAILIKAEQDAQIMQQELLTIGVQAYLEALTYGYSEVQAQQLAVGSINNIAAANSAFNSFSHQINMSIMDNWPNGGNYYYIRNGVKTNW